MENLSPRLVVITGGSKGIGRAVAYRFAQEKAKIVLAHYDADDSDSQKTLKVLAGMGVEAEAHKIDVASFENVDLFFREIFGKFERVDVLVNNAGITRDTLLMRMSEEDWDGVLNVNLKGVFNCTGSCASHDKGEGGTYCQHILCGRANRKPGAGQLFCFQGRSNRLNQDYS